MHWLIITLLVCVGVLLLAAAGVARHVRVHRKGQRQTPILESHEESDLESES